MAIKNKAYVDSSAFISFLDSSDKHHLLFARFFSNPLDLVTSPLVINETHAWFIRRYDIERGLRFLSFIEELKPLTILSIDQTELKEGEKILRRFKDQELTLVDAVGLSIMKNRDIKICWSTDRHLSLLGAELVIYR